MLNERDERQLKEIEWALREDDERFVRALGSWRPRSPREYRWGWLAVPFVVVPIGLLVATITVAALGVIAGMATFVGLWCVHRRRIDRPPRAGPGRG